MLKQIDYKDWRASLPEVEGSYTFDFPLASLTTLKVGGCADVFFEPASLADLQKFMREKDARLPLMVMGEGSNALIHDDGVRGVVISLSKALNQVTVDGLSIRAESGATGGKVARLARGEGLTGVEFLCGIPGSVGGALKMNAGAYGHETFDVVSMVEVMTPEGELQMRTPDEIGYTYRKSFLHEGWLYIAATFTLKTGDKNEIREAMRKINHDRRTSQPLDMPSSGSWFKNYVLADGSKKNAWRIVDEAGCRGMREGDAQVSEKHTNFFVNLGTAKAVDFMVLTEKVKAQVKDKTGLDLEQEVRVIGGGSFVLS